MIVSPEQVNLSVENKHLLQFCVLAATLCNLKHLKDCVMKHHALNSCIEPEHPVTSMAIPAFFGPRLIEKHS